MSSITRLHSRAELRSWRDSLSDSVTVGFVPTMGALHRGHGTLFHAACEGNEVGLASIFVNPLQFNEGADFKRYPRTADEDCALLERSGVQAVYLPDRIDMYPDGYETRVRSGPGSELYEGYHRPGHFEGMLTAVFKLFQRCRPDRAYFGEKDAQQLWLVQRMAEDLDLDVEVIGCPTVREEDGLAFSSRNAFLAPEQRAVAPIVSRALYACRESFTAGERSVALLERGMHDLLRSEPLASIEYADVVDERTFRPADSDQPGPWRAVAAVRVGDTRLIDNLELGDARSPGMT
ncbi:MAG: pantoate--beta-alanine ligase [Planctomycetes bacterium]|nr:pantoate--beta-alanine ligase [Planctomycetota bacterium]